MIMIMIIIIMMMKNAPTMGSHRNQNPRCTQKPMYTPSFTHHIRSRLLLLILPPVTCTGSIYFINKTLPFWGLLYMYSTLKRTKFDSNNCIYARWPDEHQPSGREYTTVWFWHHTTNTPYIIGHWVTCIKNTNGIPTILLLIVIVFGK